MFDIMSGDRSLMDAQTGLIITCCNMGLLSKVSKPDRKKRNFAAREHVIEIGRSQSFYQVRVGTDLPRQS
jgi:hypothetical protein